MIVIQWILGFLIQLPLYLWPAPIYALYKMDYYCGIPYEQTGGILYAEINVYLGPIIFLRIMYARLMYFIHRQSSRLLQTQHGKRIQRDMIVTRRILSLVVGLTLPGIPNIVFFAMTSANPTIAGAYYMYRIQFMGPAVVIFILSILLVIMTPQFKTIVQSGISHYDNRVRPMGQTMTEQHTQPTAGYRF